MELYAPLMKREHDDEMTVPDGQMSPESLLAGTFVSFSVHSAAYRQSRGNSQCKWLTICTVKSPFQAV